VTRTTSPRLLLSAYQCGPSMGSVSQIGWEWYSRLAPRIPTTLVTHLRNREALTKAGAPLSCSEVIFVDTERFSGSLYRLASRLLPKSLQAGFPISSLDFFVYDRCAVTLLRQKIVAGARWDIVHAVTPVSPPAPTWLHRLGPPLILGPLNGGIKTLPAFPQVTGGKSARLDPVRNIGRLVDTIVDTIVGSTRKATVILTVTRATLTSIPRRYRRLCIPMLENGVDLNVFSAAPWPIGPSKTHALRILFVGRFLPFKGVPLLLEAIARIRDEFPVRLTIVGEGPLEASWKQVTNALGLQDIVTFCGPLSAAEVAAQMRAAHVFCLPSVRESGTAVLLEAMAAARPVIAIAYGGPAEVVDDNVGRAIPPDAPEAMIETLAHTLRDVFADAESWQRRGEEGRRRAEQRYGWDAKIEQVLRLYDHILGDGQAAEMTRVGQGITALE
jgi:glycosyltransferase involved in cell wall biosynthesis